MTIEAKDVKKVADEIKERQEKNQEKNDERFSLIEQEFASIAKKAIGSKGGFSVNNTDIEQKEAFQKFVRKGDFTGLVELDVKSMSVGSDADGGYAVPEFIEQSMEKIEHDSSAIMNLANVVEAKGSIYKRLVNLRGSSSGWVGETDSRPETDSPKLAEVVIDVGEIYANPKLTQKLIDDAMFDAEVFIANEITEEFSDQLSDALINGDGVNKPKGILSYPTSDKTDKTRDFGTLQFKLTKSASLSADDIKTLKSSLKAKYRTGAAWVMNESTALALSTIKGADDRYIWQDEISEAEHDSLLGYPVHIDENMPDITAGSIPILFGNFKRGYDIPKRLGIRMLRDPFTDKPYINFYTTRRIGGGVVNSEAIKLLNIKAS